jgi:tetratricopeptide (TPR) repeat protein
MSIVSRVRALVVAGTLLVPANALAAKVLVLPYQCLGKGVPNDLAEQATVVITKEMAQGGLTIIQADDVADTPQSKPSSTRRAQDAPTGDPGAGRKAQELIARAKESVEESEFVNAIKDLKNAVRLLEENGDAVPDLRLLPEAYLQLGVAYFRNGNEDEGDDMLNKVVHLDPERQLDPADYPPIFIRTFNRARFNVLRRPRAQIEVKATKGAQVLFDGRNMGKAPLHLKEALPGNHWVRIERPGEPVQVKKISVKAQRTIVVEFEGGESSGDSGATAVGVLGAIAANDITRDHIAQLKAAGSRAGADYVMIGGIYKTDTAYMIRTAYVHVKDGVVGRLVDISFDLDMLSAEIEVYKLAEDAKNQATTKLANVVKDDRFQIAPQLKVKSGGDRRPTKSDDTKVAVVVAAPPAPPPPEAPTITDAMVADGQKAAAKGKGGAASGGRAPLANAGGDEKKDEKKPPVSMIPKDEVTQTALVAPRASGETSGGADPLTVGAVIPKDEARDDGPATWWIWALVGVAAAGAAAAGGYFILNGRSPNEGNLKVSWQ